jgi:hypothetical protein
MKTIVSTFIVAFGIMFCISQSLKKMHSVEFILNEKPEVPEYYMPHDVYKAKLENKLLMQEINILKSETELFLNR